MRTLLILSLAVFSLGAMVTLEEDGTSSEASNTKISTAEPGTLTGAVAVVRKIKSHLITDQRAHSWSDSLARDQDPPKLTVGDVLPEGANLYVVPRHESYRYAVIQRHRVIVDAASRQIVYIIR